MHQQGVPDHRLRVVSQPPPGQHCPQSIEQFMQSSPVSQAKSPQMGPVQTPQSPGQFAQFSPSCASHLRSPQRDVQTPQSIAQFVQSSPTSQVLLPHMVHRPQSSGQVTQSSPVSHTWSPQVGAHGPQSTSHVRQLSPREVQTPSPQDGAQSPQSLGHVTQDSVPLQIPSPQLQGPQSAGQFPQVSPRSRSQSWSPQKGVQVPQSLGQLVHVSPGSHTPSKQTGGQAPQSAGQLSQVSVPLQVPSPQAGGGGGAHEVGEVVKPRNCRELPSKSKMPALPGPVSACGEESVAVMTVVPSTVTRSITGPEPLTVSPSWWPLPVTTGPVPSWVYSQLLRRARPTKLSGSTYAA
jgi:hypothetical protein